jgi:hypothetical protein
MATSTLREIISRTTGQTLYEVRWVANGYFDIDSDGNWCGDLVDVITCLTGGGTAKVVPAGEVGAWMEREEVEVYGDDIHANRMTFQGRWAYLTPNQALAWRLAYD